MSDTYYEDTGVGGNSEEIESTHTDNDNWICPSCEYYLALLLLVVPWLNVESKDGFDLDLVAREKLAKEMQLLIQHLFQRQLELKANEAKTYFSNSHFESTHTDNEPWICPSCDHNLVLLSLVVPWLKVESNDGDDDDLDLVEREKLTKDFHLFIQYLFERQLQLKVNEAKMFFNYSHFKSRQTPNAGSEF